MQLIKILDVRENITGTRHPSSPVDGIEVIPLFDVIAERLLIHLSVVQP